MSTRDYTDSESETEAALLGETRDHSAMSTPAGSRSPAKPSDGGPSLKIKLRRNLNHLSTESPHAESSMTPGDRSSLSPPPPIRLKFGGKHARSTAMYSDSEEDESEIAAGAKTAGASATSTPKVARSPPAKKQKTTKPRTMSVNSSTGPTVPATGRKAYNWLTPSAAGASHTGPPDRGERHSSLVMSRGTSRTGEEDKIAGTDDKEKDTGRDSAPPSDKKKAPRRKPGDSGPGKNWRKGMRKGDPLPWKDGATFLGEGGLRGGRSSPLATPSRPSMSRDTSPTPEPFDNMLLETATAKVVASVSAKEKRERDLEEKDQERREEKREREREEKREEKRERDREDKREREREVREEKREEKPQQLQQQAHHYVREPTPPSFVLADAKVLGIPVFPNPIVTPKLVLGTFPKITSFFAPFDKDPLCKEKTRDWAVQERTITGVGGGTLKFKTWRPGPPSELSRVRAAQKEAEALAKQRKKESRESERLERGMVEATPERPERPSLPHSNSTDSVPLYVEGDGDNASEAGDDAESTAASVRDSPTPRSRGGPAKRGRPRKSKLANEIIPMEPDDETASARPSVEPDTKPAIAA